MVCTYNYVWLLSLPYSSEYMPLIVHNLHFFVFCYDTLPVHLHTVKSLISVAPTLKT